MLLSASGPTFGILGLSLQAVFFFDALQCCRTALFAILIVQNPLLGAKHIGFLQANFEGIVFAAVDVEFLVASAKGLAVLSFHLTALGLDALALCRDV